MDALTHGDISLLSKVLTEPDSITIDEHRTAAEKLGLHGGFLAAAVNTAMDPSVWIATLLSRKFPTLSWIKGTVPQRFIGTANEFSGVSLAARPVEQMFRGTTIPKLTSLAMHRHAEVMKAAKPLFDIMNRPNWAKEMPIVSLALEGVETPMLTSELRRVRDDIRGHMDNLWGFLSQTQRLTGGLDHGAKVRSQPFSIADSPEYLRDYLPHIPLTGHESTFEVSGREALERLAGRGNRPAQQLVQLANMPTPWGVSKRDGLYSKFGDYQRWVANVGAQVYNPHLFKRVRHGLQVQNPVGQELFHTDLNLMFQKYVSSVAKTYSINAPLSPHERAIASVTDEFGRQITPSSEPIMAQIINTGLDTAGVKFQATGIPGSPKVIEQIIPGTGSQPMMAALRTLTRSVRGSQSEDQILFGMMFNKMYDRIHSMRNGLGSQKAAMLTDGISTVQRMRDNRRIMDGITNWFYVSTLGGNLKSSFQNLLQPVITTAPAIGIGPTLAGMKEFFPKVQRYARSVAAEMRSLPPSSKGLVRLQEAGKQAFREAFPELADQHLEIDPRLFDVSAESLKRKVSPDGKFVDKESLFSFLMAPFTSTEISNRAITFYGAKHAMRNAIRTGEYPLPRLPDGGSLSPAQIDDLLNFEAANAVSATQFRPGPGSRTVLQSMLPSPLRQFTTFPVRLGNFFAESTVRGAMTQEQLAGMSFLGRLGTFGGRNLGTLARTYLYGRIAANGFRDVLGVDITNAIGLTLPFQPAPSDQAFAPFPLPPAPSLLFGVASAAAGRDYEKLNGLELPGNIKTPFPKVLFPAGVALNRLFETMNQFRPDMGGFVDQDERLIYHGSTKDAILQAIGIPLDKARRERQTMERLHAVRGVQREFQRRIRLAYSRFDLGEVRRLQDHHRKLFPDVPAPNISQTQLDEYNAEKRLTRVQRMLDTLPSSFGFLGDQIFDYDPDLVTPAQPTFGLLAG